MPKTCTMIEFSKERASFTAGRTEEIPAHLANYLIAKSQKLSQYLKDALHLIETEGFKF